MHLNPRPRIAFLSFFAFTIFVACTEPAGPDNTPKEIVLSSVDTLRSIGETVALTALIRNADGEPITSGTALNWESSNPNVVTVNATTGIATSASNGSAYVRARSMGAIDSVKVVVLQRIDPTRSTLSVSSLLSFVGDTVRMTLQGRDALGRMMTRGGSVVFITRSGGSAGGMMLPTIDWGDGTYTSGFIGSNPGTDAEATALIDGTPISTPSPLITVLGFTKLAVSSDASALTCGIVTTGKLYCWGQQHAGLRGTGNATEPEVGPTLVIGSDQWIDVDIGPAAACAITRNKKLYCWGSALDGALGNGTTAGLFPSPVPILPESSFVSIDMGLNGGNCAITASQAGMCWSKGRGGRIGNGADTSVSIPVAVNGGHSFVAISTSSSGTCGVTDAGVAMCWGAFVTLGGAGLGSFGEFCNTPGCNWSPIAVMSDQRFKPIIFHGGEEACAIATTNDIYCWSGATVPMRLAGAEQFTTIVSGDTDNCGTWGGGVYCWGTNRNARFGNPRSLFEIHRVPELVLEGFPFIQLAMGQNHMCGILSNGHAWCWGRNSNGELGDRTRFDSAIPVKVRLLPP